MAALVPVSYSEVCCYGMWHTRPSYYTEAGDTPCPAETHLGSQATVRPRALPLAAMPPAGALPGRFATLGSGGRRGSYGSKLLAALGTSPNPAGKVRLYLTYYLSSAK